MGKKPKCANLEFEFHSPTSRASSVHILPRCTRRRKLGAGGCSPCNSVGQVFHNISFTRAAVVSSGNERVRRCPVTRRNVSVTWGSEGLGEGLSGVGDTGSLGVGKMPRYVVECWGVLVGGNLGGLAARRGDTCVVSWVFIKGADAAEGVTAVSRERPSWVGVVVVWAIAIDMCTFVLVGGVFSSYLRVKTRVHTVLTQITE